MALKVLIVDDSSFFRKRLSEIISGDPTLEVCGEAKDGKEGVEKCRQLRPDVITMDVEMPVMDGITAVREIMAKCPTPILMFSSLTFEGANSTFKALEAGAVDFMPKNFDAIAHRREDALAELRNNIKAVARSRIRRTPAPSAPAAAVRSTLSTSAGSTPGTRSSTLSTLRTPSGSTGTTAGSSTARSFSARPAAVSTQPLRSTSTTLRPALGSAPARSSTLSAEGSSARMSFEKIQSQLANVDQGRPASTMNFTFGNHRGETTRFRKSGKLHDIVAIGSSTGGPIALQKVIPLLPKLNVPVVIVQHMPASFTTTFAQRLDNMSKLHVVEAQDNMLLEPGCCYIAPGGMQMIFERGMSKVKVRILKGDNRVVYHPCVDVSFASLAQIYGGRVLAMILTGMGSDGCEGCRLLKKSGSVIWAQNEETCVVYGMPQAVVNAGLADQVLPIEHFASCITEEMR